MDTDFYVYVLLDPRRPGNYAYGEVAFGYEPFYVGKGRLGRWDYHLDEAAHSRTTNHKCNKIRKILREAGVPYKVCIQGCELLEKDAYALEILLIKGIGRADLSTGPLTNLTGGGEGFGSGENHHIHAKIQDRTHNFFTDREFFDTIRRQNNVDRIQSGEHHFLDSEWQSKYTRQRYENGTHYLCNPENRVANYNKSVEDNHGEHPMVTAIKQNGFPDPKRSPMRYKVDQFLDTVDPGSYFISKELAVSLFGECRVSGAVRAFEQAIHWRNKNRQCFRYYLTQTRFKVRNVFIYAITKDIYNAT